MTAYPFVCYSRALCLWSYLIVTGWIQSTSVWGSAVGSCLSQCSIPLCDTASPFLKTHLGLESSGAEMGPTCVPWWSGTLISVRHQKREMDHRLVAKQLFKSLQSNSSYFLCMVRRAQDFPSGWISNSLSTMCQIHKAATHPCHQSLLQQF